jgi:hypothetical protein
LRRPAVVGHGREQRIDARVLVADEVEAAGVGGVDRGKRGVVQRDDGVVEEDGVKEREVGDAAAGVAGDRAVADVEQPGVELDAGAGGIVGDGAVEEVELV